MAICLWRLLECLAQADEDLDRNASFTIDSENAQMMIHRDIKPKNIFLGEQGDVFAAYRTAKLGDSGLCVLSRDDDPFQPLGYLGSGTPDYRAPEQHESYNDSPDDLARVQIPVRLGVKPNIGAIGKTLLELMNERHEPSQLLSYQVSV